jgi:hypothetical protein
MNRTTLVLPNHLYEELRREAFDKHMSLAAVIRMRLEYRPPAATTPAEAQDPLLAIAGLADSGTLTANLDAELYEI